ncbi:MAG: hypothetical protein IEMM0006_1150 [bacterium]|nr:MAG: hypothetical protein IEMM0006_1150 [bacterium]
MHYRDNARKFEEVYEKLRKPYGNKCDKQSDIVKIFLNSYGYSEKFMPCILFISFVS